MNRSMMTGVLAIALGIALGTTPAFAGTVQIPFSSVPSGSTLINFDVDAQGTPILNSTPTMWSSLGVTFEAIDHNTGFPIRSSPWSFGGDASNLGPIEATFSPRIKMVGAWGFDFQLEVFDAQNHSLGVGTFTDGTPGLFAGNAEFGFLGFSSTVPIARAEFRRAFPNQSTYGFLIDDLVFNQTPEPEAWQLAAIGLATMCVLARVRRKRASRCGRNPRSRLAHDP